MSVGIEIELIEGAHEDNGQQLTLECNEPTYDRVLALLLRDPDIQSQLTGKELKRPVISIFCVQKRIAPSGMMSMLFGIFMMAILLFLIAATVVGCIVIARWMINLF